MLSQPAPGCGPKESSNRDALPCSLKGTSNRCLCQITAIRWRSTSRSQTLDGQRGSRSTEAHRVDGGGRGTQAEGPPGSGMPRKQTQESPGKRARRGIEERKAVLGLSATSEFAGTPVRRSLAYKRPISLRIPRNNFFSSPVRSSLGPRTGPPANPSISIAAFRMPT